MTNDGCGDVELFGMFRRLRKCRRCGHPPCPHCVVWCDCFHMEDDSPDPCSEDNECLMTYRDWECNQEVFKIFDRMCKELEKNGAVITGDSTTKDGRLIAIGYYKETA